MIAELLPVFFFLGLQAISLCLFVLNNLFKINLLQVPVWPFWMTLAGTLIYFSSKRSKFVLVTLILSVLFSLPAFWYPVTDWDAVTLFDFRAKILMQTGQISDVLFRAKISEYPLFTSLIHFFIFRSNISSPMPLYALVYLFFGLHLYSLFHRILNVRTSLLFSLVILLAPKLFEHSLIAYTNLPYTIYLIIGTFYLYIWTNNHRRADLLLGIMFCLSTFWIRGFPFGIIPIFVAVATRIKSRKIISAILLLGGLMAIYRFWPVNIKLLLEVLDFIKWGVIKYYFPYPLIFVLTLIYQIRARAKNWFMPATILGFWAAIILGNYHYALTDPVFARIPDALQRTVMFINPAISLYFVLLSTNKSKT